MGIKKNRVEIMQIMTFGFWRKPNLLKEINEWLYTPCSESKRVESITINLPEGTIEMIDKETNNRSWFIRKRVFEALAFFPKVFDKPHFPSRSEFIRSAIDHYFIQSYLGREYEDNDDFLEKNNIIVIGEA